MDFFQDSDHHRRRTPSYSSIHMGRKDRYCNNRRGWFARVRLGESAPHQNNIRRRRSRGTAVQPSDASILRSARAGGGKDNSRGDPFRPCICGIRAYIQLPCTTDPSSTVNPAPLACLCVYVYIYV